MRDNPYSAVREGTHEVVYKNGYRRIQRTGWDSQGRVVHRFVDEYSPEGQHVNVGKAVENDGKWHGGGMITGPNGEYIADSCMAPYDFDPKKSYGQIIFEYYEKSVEDGTASDYEREIVYACREDGCRVPIKKESMYKALEEADKLCLSVFVVPDKTLEEGNTCEGPYGGCSFHPEVRPNEDVLEYK